nr:hypothetical protein Cplu_332 [Cedratvirus plubellavi]
MCAWDIIRIAHVDSSLRNMCLQERFWKAKFSKEKIPLPLLDRRSLSLAVDVYERCKQTVYPRVLEVLARKHHVLFTIKLAEIPRVCFFPSRLRDRILPHLNAAYTAAKEEEEKSRELFSLWAKSPVIVIDENTFSPSFNLSMLADGTLLIKKWTTVEKVCFAEKLSREEAELFLLHLILLKGYV